VWPTSTRRPESTSTEPSGAESAGRMVITELWGLGLLIIYHLEPLELPAELCCIPIELDFRLIDFYYLVIWGNLGRLLSGILIGLFIH